MQRGSSTSPLTWLPAWVAAHRAELAALEAAVPAWHCDPTGWAFDAATRALRAGFGRSYFPVPYAAGNLLDQNVPDSISAGEACFSSHSFKAGVIIFLNRGGTSAINSMPR